MNPGRFLLLCALSGSLMQKNFHSLAQGKVQLRRTSEGGLILTNMSRPNLARIEVFRTEHKEKYREIAEEAARKYGIDFNLLDAVIETESQYQPRAVSHKGAQGLMQIMPKTGWELGLEDAFDPAQNIDAGARYLRAMLDRFGSTELALAAYNAGPKAVENYGGVPPYRETHLYVNSIMRRIGVQNNLSYKTAKKGMIKVKKVRTKKDEKGSIILHN